LKSITYVSTATQSLSESEFDAIAKVSVLNNSAANVTGILVLCGEFFLQILEGEEVDVDTTLERIRHDPRHRNIQVLKVDHDLAQRQFPDWSMQTVQLNHVNDTLIHGMRMMLGNLAESRYILEHYTQPAVLKYIQEGVNPLEAPYVRKDKVILFGDIAAFDTLSTFYASEEVAEHVSAFLEVVSQAVTAKGGEVNKYMGDKVMAYFDPDHVDAAIECCLESLEKIRVLRSTAAQCRLRNFLYGGFGLSLGPVIEGSFGSSYKMDHTILGNAVNVAARMMNFTRSTGRALMVEESVMEASRSGWDWHQLGEFKLKGQMNERKYYSLNNPVVGDMRTVDEMIAEVMSTTEEHRRNCPC
jgi:class 3 adenylate cyclase